MTDRLSDVEARIHTVHQLSSVITAMRGIAAARSRAAKAQLDGVRAYARTIGGAIGHALAFPADGQRAARRQEGAGAHALVVLCAEQGFVGPFNEHVFDTAAAIRAREPEVPVRLLLAGDRGLLVADERGIRVDWSTSMISHPDQAAALASRIADALYLDAPEGVKVTRVSLVHAIPGGASEVEMVERRLIPFDFERFPLPKRAIAPLITLPPAVLLERLVDEYVFAELCEAVVLSFAAENEARMRAMIAARAHVSDTLDTLTSHARQLRQEEITNEIIELASGALAAMGDGSHR